MERYQEIERSLIKKYRKSIWKRFIAGINEYRMIREGDRIAVCISGGKDSMLLAKCLQEIQRHGRMSFALEFLVMDPGYSTPNRALIEQNAKTLDLPIHVFSTDIFSVVENISGSPCYLCARMRRGHLYKEAGALGCNKIALGHHFDDVIETVLMSLLYGGEMRTMMPKLHSSNFAGMELIRPLYMVREEDIQSWARYNALQFLQCACRFTEQNGREELPHASKRLEMKQLIRQLRKANPQIEMNIFRSAEHVNLDTLIGYRGRKGQYHFLDDYNRDESEPAPGVSGFRGDFLRDI